MFEAFLTNTSIEGLRPLGTAPQRSYELVSGTVRAELGAQAAALFAEPVATQYGDRFDWYAAVEGKAQPLADLDEEARAAAEAELARLSGEIRTLAARFSGAETPEEQRLGEALENALSYPEDGVFVVMGADGPPQPVLVNWAWVSDRQAVVAGSLRAPDARPAPKPTLPPAGAVPVGAAAAAGTVARAAPWALPLWLVWLLGLLLALLLAAIVWLMVPACGVKMPFMVSYCEQAAENDAAARQSRVLQDRIAILERQIGIADRACQPDPFDGVPIPNLPALAQTPPATLPDIDARRSEAGAALGDLTFTLAWDGPDDLDLMVTCPAGVTVSHLRREACNGQLDVDSNVGEPVPQPVENIFFTGPQGGVYGIRVQMYSSRSGGADTPFQLQIRAGDRVENLSGIVSGQTRDWTQSYNYGGQ
jgi:hypothetical protein